ncbi:hypothetical protein NP233_g5328 [Leucocoprinus birnbaumii]|uniref:F-box domain-containing protein n=1 Tax=Leucocoprinus birnbaumii TaxID=56174 RepID=A0AAD5VT29_9AGAR|nr:hypothetical protein NP233_g5328 [Leucocoprinus birnbaumii]
MVLSFLDDKLTTNYAPTTAELLTLQELLDGPNQRLAGIENRIPNIEERLRELDQERFVLENKAASLQMMLTPARRLLPEILQEIFARCLPPGGTPPMSARESPLLLGRVCRQWRNIAYSTPVLWSGLHIAVPPDTPYARRCSISVRLEATKEWLSRSGICSLSISLSGPQGYYPGVRADLKTVPLYLETISPFLPRCQYFYFFCSEISSWHFLLEKCVPSQAPFLKYIHFDFANTPSDSEVLGASGGASRLFSSSELHAIFLSSHERRLMQLPVQWAQLTILNLFKRPSTWIPGSALLVHDALLLLSWCPHLVFCSIPISETSLPYRSVDSNRGSKMVSLLQLFGFSVRCDFDPEPFYRYLNIPSLRYFQHYQETPQSMGTRLDGEVRALHLALRPFIQRVVHPIEELQILSTFLSMNDFIQCLKLFPELKRLSLIGHVYPHFAIVDLTIPMITLSDQFLEYLIPNYRSSNLPLSEVTEQGESDEDLNICVCPKLEMLDIIEPTFSDILMLEFIRSRMVQGMGATNDVSRLRWLNIRFPYDRVAMPGTMDEVAELKACTGAHINVYFNQNRITLGWGPFGTDTPYNGLASVDYLGHPNHQYIPYFGTMLDPRL